MNISVNMYSKCEVVDTYQSNTYKVLNLIRIYKNCICFPDHYAKIHETLRLFVE